eukprot:TRINITY_DN41664_c0_g1_i1.p1 TRINITY_DN41664_c0_g1~~TRINITY_DN41664_c0_g1_i1.p1  ORF type:complete len:657 (+),score=100.13 TRINITY_DN41664_c0_g1_i1:45-1973(+)
MCAHGQQACPGAMDMAPLAAPRRPGIAAAPESLPTVRPPPGKLGSLSARGQHTERFWRDGCPVPPSAAPIASPGKSIESVLRNGSTLGPAAPPSPSSASRLMSARLQQADRLGVDTDMGPEFMASDTADVSSLAAFQQQPRTSSGGSVNSCRSVGVRVPAAEPPKGPRRRYRAASEDRSKFGGYNADASEPAASSSPSSASRPRACGATGQRHPAAKGMPLSARDTRGSRDSRGLAGYVAEPERLMRSQSPTSHSQPPRLRSTAAKDSVPLAGRSASHRASATESSEMRGPRRALPSPRPGEVLPPLGQGPEAASAGKVTRPGRSDGSVERSNTSLCHEDDVLGSNGQTQQQEHAAPTTTSGRPQSKRPPLAAPKEPRIRDDAPELLADNLTTLLLAYSWPSMFKESPDQRPPEEAAAIQQDPAGDEKASLLEQLNSEREAVEAKIAQLRRPMTGSDATTANIDSASIDDRPSTRQAASPSVLSTVEQEASDGETPRSHQVLPSDLDATAEDSHGPAMEAEEEPDATSNGGRIAAAMREVGMTPGPEAAVELALLATPARRASTAESCSTSSAKTTTDRWALSARRWAAQRLRRKREGGKQSRSGTPSGAMFADVQMFPGEAAAVSEEPDLQRSADVASDQD